MGAARFTSTSATTRSLWSTAGRLRAIIVRTLSV
ncbi:hypothetical protein [Klebsiella phage Kpn17]|uniref:Uncharacterized protein n=1 Tax=Klebsiella phage Kpn17 TaxID=3044025 RepID=A0AAT9V708_9CAUD|nr:hypothetical protein [Klebsiella phage Kpn17]